MHIDNQLTDGDLLQLRNSVGQHSVVFIRNVLMQHAEAIKHTAMEGVSQEQYLRLQGRYALTQELIHLLQRD